MFIDIKVPDLEGLGHYITAPVDSYRNPLLDDNSITYYRSMTENRIPRHELKVDRLSEQEKVIGKI